MIKIKIIKTSAYNKDYDKKIIKKHLDKERITIEKVERLIIESINMKELLLNPLHYVYGIEKKKGNLKEVYTFKINSKLRGYFIPDAEYPYNNLEKIIDVQFLKIVDKHYGDG